MVQQSHSLRPACKDFEEHLVLYYYGDCPAPERDKLEEHLKECASCSRFLEDLRAYLPLMVRPKNLPQAFWDSYYRELQKKLAALEEKGAWWRELRSFVRPWAVPALGAVLGLVLALGVTFSRGTWRLWERSNTEEIPQEIRVAANDIDFFEVMDLLDSIDLLEALEKTKSASTGSQRL